MDEDIRQILELERVNNGHIHLYKIDGHWLAFERSAFNLFSVCERVDSIFKIKDLKEKVPNVFIVVVKDEVRELFNYSQFRVLKKTDSEILMSCSNTYRGFLYWKDHLGSLFTGNPQLALPNNISWIPSGFDDVVELK